MTARLLFIRTEHDAAEATRAARELGLACGLSATEAVALATAVSELASNQLRHARRGTLDLRPVDDGSRCGVRVVAADSGPGIADLEAALRDGWSGGGGLGLGLPGARRLADEFELHSAPGRGTTIRMVKWRAAAPAQVDTRRLVSWATAGAPRATGGYAPVVLRLAAGLLLAVVRAGGVARVRELAAMPPARLAERLGGRDAALARLEALDSRVVWQAQPLAAAALYRPRGDRLVHVATAPRHRSASLPVLRSDLLVLASCTPGDLPAGAGPRQAAEAVRAAGPPGAVVLVARLERGSLERRG